MANQKVKACYTDMDNFTLKSNNIAAESIGG